MEIKNIVIICCLLIFAGSVSAQEYKYVGAKKCAKCHKSNAKGNQYKKWKNSKHSKAYDLLLTDEGKKRAEANNITDPTTSPDCLKCHSPGDLKTELWAKNSKMEKHEGVSCETCHGPGSKFLYKMKPVENAVAHGLVQPNAEKCLECHDPANAPINGHPMPVFDFTEQYKKISHVRP